MLVSPSALGSPLLEPAEIYRRALPGVMTLEVETRGGGKIIGTAFTAIRPGLAVTASHLLEDAQSVTARFSDSTECRVLGLIDQDKIKDIALIRLEIEDRPMSPLGQCDLPVGSRAYVIGAPSGYEFSITDGLISQFQFIDGFFQYQLTCPISPGNSGGPFLNARGEVMGVVAWSKKDSQNLNFATPILEALRLDSTRELTPWNELKKRSWFSRTFSKKRDHQTDLTAPPAADATAFRSLLQKSAHKRIHLSVETEAGIQDFSFVVTPEWFEGK